MGRSIGSVSGYCRSLSGIGRSIGSVSGFLQELVWNGKEYWFCIWVLYRSLSGMGRSIDSVSGCSVGACLEWEGVLVLYLGALQELVWNRQECWFCIWVHCRSLSRMGRRICSVSGCSVGACLEWEGLSVLYLGALQELVWNGKDYWFCIWVLCRSLSGMGRSIGSVSGCSVGELVLYLGALQELVWNGKEYWFCIWVSVGACLEWDGVLVLYLGPLQELVWNGVLEKVINQPYKNTHKGSRIRTLYNQATIKTILSQQNQDERN